MRPSHSFGILSGLVVLGTAALSSTAALASSPVVQTHNVSYIAAELADPAAAAALYKRIQSAARIVCEQPFGREVDRYMEFQKCYDRAVDSAVANVNATTLTAVHHKRTQRLAAG